MPTTATAAMRRRGSAQSPIAGEDAQTSPPIGQRKAHFCAIVCHWSRGRASRGPPTDSAWHDTQAVPSRTVKDLRYPQGHGVVTVEALYGGERLSCLPQWVDPAVSAKRFPLLKTAQCGQVLHTEMEQEDKVGRR